ncbi:MAG: methyltransferase domain-containing protein [Planctomycetes bacterium]|nr:methyltransferase domain-containing protein [Planctomycetota bacterium]
MPEAAELRESVKTAYSAAAEHPGDEHPFPVGRPFAQSVGYDAKLLESLPRCAVEAFAGVSNVAVLAELFEGGTVLDLGCGAGLDTLIAARRVGLGGKVVGVDFSASMLARARRAALEAALANVEFELADAEALPLEDASVDVALVNGIFNLNPHRQAIFRELARVTRPEGNVFGAELILLEPLPAAERASPTNWFA